MDNYHFSTVVSQDHLYKFIAMYTSLESHCTGYQIYVLCASRVVYDILTAIRFPHVVPVDLKRIEDDELLYAKRERIFHAYCWTLKPVFLHYVMTQYPDARFFAHLDADLFFFNTPDLLFSEKPDASLYLTHHRNSPSFWKFYYVTGVYNTGFVGCRGDAAGLAAVSRWRGQCVEYCPIQEDPMRRAFGDQRYVEDWPELYPGRVHVIESLGANAALWNITEYTVSDRGGTLFLNEDPLIFYHFSGLTAVDANEYNLCWYYHIDSDDIVDRIYLPYVRLLKKTVEELGVYYPDFHEGFTRRELIPATHFIRI